MIGAQIRGDKQALRNLEELPTRMRRLAITRSMRVSLKPLRTTAQRLVPKKTGMLRKNIKLVMWKRSRSKEAKLNPKVGMSVQVGRLGWYKGKAFYGGMQEFGRYLLSAFGGPKGLSEAVVDCYHNAPSTARAQLLINVMKFLQGQPPDELDKKTDPDDVRAQVLRLMEELRAE